MDAPSGAQPMQPLGTEPKSVALPGYARMQPREEPEPAEAMVVLDARDDFARMANERFRVYSQARRQNIEDEWSLAWHNKEGRPTAEVKAQLEKIQRSKVFVKITATKVTAAKSLIMQVHSGPDGIQWGMRPTPNPELDGINAEVIKEAAEMAAQALPPEEQQGFLESNNVDELLDQAKSQADQAMDRMRRTIRDNMAEMKMDSFFIQALDGYITYGTAVMQGPMSVPKKRKMWHKDKDGKWTTALNRKAEADKREQAGEKDEDSDPEDLDIRPEYWSHSVWTVFPDPAATCEEEMEDVFVRHVYSPHEFRALRNRQGFDGDKINDIMKRFPNGNWVPEPWEGVVQAQASGSLSMSATPRFVVLERWAWLSGTDLKEAGVEVPDKYLNTDCVAQIWTCQDRTIMAAVDNFVPERLPFVFAPYERVENRIWGKGVPNQMSDTQAMWNASQRAIMDNMKVTAGPQIVIDESRLSDRTDPATLYPFKEWFVKDMEGLARDPVYFFNPQNNIQHMSAIQAGLRLHMQMETSIPDFATGIPGAQGHNRTAEGMVLQQGMALNFIRSQIANMDVHWIKPMIEGFFHWNMHFNPDESIKGDFEVVANGVMAAMSNEILTGKLERVMQSPWAEKILKMNKVLPEWARRNGLMDLDLAYTPDEIAARQKQEAMMQAEADAIPKRVSPQMPKLNALVQIFGSLQPNDPTRGPVLEQAMSELGSLTAPMVAAINAMNQQAVALHAANLSKADAEALAHDLIAQGALNEGAQGTGVEPGIPGEGGQAVGMPPEATGA